MNYRVLKKFGFKIFIGVVAIVYFGGMPVLTALIAQHAGYDFDTGLTAGVSVFVFLPLIALIVATVYDQARQEVENEDREIIDRLSE